MRITKRQLRRIIKEERARILKEYVESETGSPLIEFARAYAGMGAAVQEQVDAVIGAYINGGGPESDAFRDIVYEQNPAAIDMAMDKIGRVLRNSGICEEGEIILEALEAAQEVINQ